MWSLLTDLRTLESKQPQPGQKPVLELAAYLVMPISRIPRYKLLLEVRLSRVYCFVRVSCVVWYTGTHRLGAGASQVHSTRSP
jgi:hypothetical protein